MTQILMPALSPTMEEGNLTKWLVKVGDTIEPGQVIAEIETDKATMEVEAVDEGTVTELLVEEGAQGVKVNTPIAVLSGEGEAPTPSQDPKKPAQPEMREGPAKVSRSEPSRTSASAPKADPEIPAGTQMIKITVRDALRDAMAEEMRADDRVFVMGEEVAEYQGAYKVTRELLQEFGPMRVVDTPITEHGFAGLGVGAAMAGLKPVRRLSPLARTKRASNSLCAMSTPPLFCRRSACRTLQRPENWKAASRCC